MNKSNLFSPSRLKMAREFRGWTGKKLAEALEITPMTVSGWEDGKWQPAREVVQELAMALDFPVSWFAQEDVCLVDNFALSFRAQSRMTAGLRKQSARTWDMAALLGAKLRDEFNLPPVNLPDYSDELNSSSETQFSPESAAIRLRHEWQLGFDPIENLVGLLESKGVLVFWTDIDNRSVDAYCHWDNDNPIIVLNLNQRAGERSRFNAAHELGHLILHRESVYRQHFSDEEEPGDDGESRQKREQEANAFASAFLLPEDSFGQESPLQPILEAFFPLKERWMVSIAAMVRRNSDLGYFSGDQYERAMTRLGANHWRLEEPNPLQNEESLVHQQVFEHLTEEGVTVDAFARSLHMRVEDVCVLMPVARTFRLAQREKTSSRSNARSNVLMFPSNQVA